ncbi:MAG: tRNA (N6-isopentenyl adenosine(37)-C2)-methylthiotransferase MiaB [Planctomycetota bacterium]
MSLPRFATRAGGAAGSGPALHVVTFGCQMNKYDSLLVEGRFVARGWRLVEAMDEADLILFNTCSVREHAEERVYSWLGELRRAKRARPDLVLGVMGCLAQRAEEEVFARAAHVDIVCGTRQFQNLPDLVEELVARRADPRSGQAAAHRLLATDPSPRVTVDRSREVYTGGPAGYLAVMRGCDLSCTFCIVPAVRGRVVSRPLPEIVAEARWMVEGGARAITLLGQTVNSYGADLLAPPSGTPRGPGRRGRPDLADVIRALQGIDGLARIRLVTLHPAYVTASLAQALAECDKAERFLPLPAQSGSDAVLRGMKRGYTSDLYRRRVDLLRAAVPDLELSSDWIVGFPGETEEDFAASEALLAEIGFAQGFVFKYDPRPGTPAAGRADDVPAAVKKERHARLLAAAERAALLRMESWIGRTVTVLVEGGAGRRKGLLRGAGMHGLPVAFPGEESLGGATVRVRVGEASPYGLAGTRV